MTSSPSNRPTLSLDDAARRLGCCRRSIYTYIRQGRLETKRTINGSQRVYTDSIDHMKQTYRPNYARKHGKYEH